MTEKKSRFHGVQKLHGSDRYKMKIEIFGQQYLSEPFDEEFTAAMLYDAMCHVLKRDTRKNFPQCSSYGHLTKIAKEIYRRARQDHPDEVRKKQSLAAVKAKIRSYERTDREKTIVEVASTAGIQHAAANPSLPMVDPSLPACKLTHKLRVQNPTAAPRLAMLQFPWKTTLAERQLYWRAFARGCRKVVLNRQRRGATPEEAAQIAASF